jgi:hypothetical protein
MSEPKPERPARTGARRKQPETSRGLPPIVYPRCNGPIVPGQQVAPLFAAKLVRWSEPGAVQAPDDSRNYPDRWFAWASGHVRWRSIEAASCNGSERERAELAAFEALLSKCIADALVAQLRKEADAHGVDVLTWLTRDKGTDE